MSGRREMPATEIPARIASEPAESKGKGRAVRIEPPASQNRAAATANAKTARAAAGGGVLAVIAAGTAATSQLGGFSNELAKLSTQHGWLYPAGLVVIALVFLYVFREVMQRNTALTLVKPTTMATVLADSIGGSAQPSAHGPTRALFTRSATVDR